MPWKWLHNGHIFAHYNAISVDFTGWGKKVIMDISISDFINFFMEEDFLEVNIFDLEKNEVVFSGFLSDMPHELRQAEVASVDNPFMTDPKHLTINI